MFSDLVSIALPLLEGLDTPRSLTVKLLIEHGEWDQLVGLTTDPKHYTSADLYRRDVQATDFLRKLEGLPTSVNLQAVAVDGFIAAEKQCFRTNRRLLPLLEFPDGPLSDEEWRLLDFVKKARKIITSILGPLPRFLDGKFGPGATFEDRGRKVTLGHKMSSRPTVTPEARCLLDIWSDTAWCRALLKESPDHSNPKTVRGNRFVTVPKDSTKDRGIAIEPSINVFFQLAVGSEIRSRLKRVGIDLELGQDLHRSLAMVSSRDDTLATIDLSSASDTISTTLVKLLLPNDWYSLLECLRSPFTQMGDRWVRLEKFSSMGNGYTFELETLIFYALTKSAGAEFSKVYGDDIIVEKGIASSVITVLKMFGFAPNVKKTFTEGYFRESCGGDFFNGVSVRAHFQKKVPSQPDHWISLYNGLYHRCEYESRRARAEILRRIPADIRVLYGPPSFGDLVLHSDDINRWQLRIIDSRRELRAWVPFAKRIPLSRFGGETQLACALYGVPSDGFSPRGAVGGFRKRWLSFP